MPEKKAYDSYNAEDFAQDRWFFEWAVSGDVRAREFWEGWLREHPEKEPEVTRAKALLRVLDAAPYKPGPEEIDGLIDDTVEKIRQLRTHRFIPWKWIGYAASVLLVLGIIRGGSRLWDTFPEVSVIRDETVPASGQEVRNTGSKPQTVDLPDGSKVTLNPGAALTYASDFNGTERRTQLTGEAFFEVSRNPEKPFLVVTEDLVTKVLGTSFWVNSDRSGKRSVVSVYTGKVSVMRKTAADAGGEEVILTSNQQVVFSLKSDRMSKMLTAKPRMLHIPEGGKFVYEDEPIVQVFRDLETVYGLKLIYDEELLRGCQITATLGDEPFFEKLDLICRSIRATYRQRNADILISSEGCNY